MSIADAHERLRRSRVDFDARFSMSFPADVSRDRRDVTSSETRSQSKSSFKFDAPSSPDQLPSSPAVSPDRAKQIENEEASCDALVEQARSQRRASGMFEVPSLSRDDTTGTPVPVDDVRESDESRQSISNDVMFLPRSTHERQQLADDIVQKYLKNYDLNKPHTSFVEPKRARDVDDVTRESAGVATASRLPVPSPTRPKVQFADAPDERRREERTRSDDVFDVTSSPSSPSKTSIPIRSGSDVEDRYRRDRSQSREGKSECCIDDIMKRYSKSTAPCEDHSSTN